MLTSTRRDVLTTLAPAAAAAVLASPRLAMAQATPRSGGTLRVGFISDSKTFDPIFSVQFTERYVLYLVYNTLVQYGPDFSIRPELAESWSIGNGGKDMTFVLRKGVRFQDGTDFTADTVKWNIDRRLDPVVNSPQRKELASIIDQVQVVDPHTVTFHLKEPSPVLLSLLGERPGFMVSPAAAMKYGQDFGSHPVGTGPFLFKEWIRGSHVSVARNPAYWESGKPYLDRIEFQDTPDSVIAIQRMLAQEVDYADQISPQEVKEIEHRQGIDLFPTKVGRWYFLQWHVYQPPFNNPKLRQAVAYAIDKERINGIVMAGRGQVSQGPTPPGLWWFDPKVQSYPYDPAKAKEMLKEAGYPHGFNSVLSTPQIEILQEINQLVQVQLAAVGIKVRLDPVAGNEYYARMVKRETNFTPTAWTQRADPDGLLYILFDKNGYANSTGYDNPRVNQLLEQARTVYDQKVRKPIYDEIQSILARDIPVLPLFFSVEYAALRHNIHGFEWIPDDIPRFRYLWKS